MEKATKIWCIPYIDQPPDFWKSLYEEFHPFIKEVYFPISGEIVGSGRPPQPNRYLNLFLRSSPFSCSVLINPIVLPRPVEEIAPIIIETLRKFYEEFGIKSATVTNLLLAFQIRETLPHFELIASVLMDIFKVNQVLMLNHVFDVLVPSSRIMRNLSALQEIRKAFSGRLRLIVNEACLPGCPFRVQHFYEMASGFPYPKSLCQTLLQKYPWMRLTGAWVLPQHLHLYEGVYDELKLDGRATLHDPERYKQVLHAYINRTPLTPDTIGGGPASVLYPFPIEEKFYAYTLYCGHKCHECNVCQNYYQKIKRRVKQ